MTNIPHRHRQRQWPTSPQEFVDAEKIVLDYVNGTGKKTSCRPERCAQGILGGRREADDA